MSRRHGVGESTIYAWKSQYTGMELSDIKRLKHAPVHANRVLSSIKQAFNSAVSRGRMQHNPAACIRAKDIGDTEKPRERYLSLDEIKTLWQFLDSDKN